MNIKVVNFEELTRYHSLYQSGVEKINSVKADFVKRLEPFKADMQKMITDSTKITDEVILKENATRFQELQDQAVEIDNQFKAKMREMNDTLSKEIYSNLEEIISQWASNNDVDMVISSTEIVFLNEKHFITNEIIQILKEKDLYVDLSMA